MAENFIDYIRVCVRSGKGGAGCSHFYRDGLTAKGGPDGGDGGRGGSVILRGNRNMWTLLHLRYKKHLYAGDGMPGQGKNCSGKSGEDITIEVPLGTIVIDEETGEKLCEITEQGEEKVLFAGGRAGEMGRESWVAMELKVLADVGLVGFPNAGKSTLLASISAAKPKIANYPFTTLTPNLGIVEYRDHKSFVMADIPGIIENAHEGKGLGHRFLRHIERNSVLLFMVASDAPDIKKEYKILEKELKLFNPELMDKPRLLCITKCDLIDEEIQKLLIKPTLPRKIPHIFISAVAEQGLMELKDKLWQMINAE
jgi:GTPase